MKKSYFLWQHKLLEGLSFLWIALTYVVAIIVCNTYEGEFPVHYNATGEVDSYGTPGTLFIMPSIILVVLFLISLLAHFTPAESFNTPFKKNPKNIASVMKYCLYTLVSVEFIISLYTLYTTINWGVFLTVIPWYISMVIFLIVLAADITYFTIKASKENKK